MLKASIQSLRGEILKDAKIRTKESRKDTEKNDWGKVDFKLETAKEIDGETLDLLMSLLGNGTTPATNDGTDLLGISGDCIGALCKMFCDPNAKGYDSISETEPPCGAKDPVKGAYLDTKANRTRVLDTGQGAHLIDNIEVTNKRDRMRVSGFRGEDTIVSNGSGNVSVSTLNECFEHTKLELSRVQDIPGLPDDIISLARLVEDDDYTFHAAPGGNIYLQHPDPEVTSIPVWIENGIFVLANAHNRLMSSRIKSKLRGESYTRDSATYLRRR